MKKLKLSDGRSLTFRHWPGAPGTRLWIVFIPGSAAQIWDLNSAERRALVGRFHFDRPHVLLINKPGINARGRIDGRLFERSFRRQIRIRDYLEVLSELVPKKHKILLVGFSEGAYLAPEIALRDRRVRALSLISGGTRSWLDEEIFKEGGAHVLRRVGHVYARPTCTQALWHGLSNATWISYDTDRTAQVLHQLEVPVLAQFGERDAMIDLDSAIADLKSVARTRTQATLIRIFPRVDHTLGHLWPTALRNTGKFLRKFSSQF